MNDREWKTPLEVDEMLRDLDEIAEDIEKAINMWPEIEAEFPAENEQEKAGSSAPDFSTEEEKEERK